jgi:hypothetical protein
MVWSSGWSRRLIFWPGESPAFLSPRFPFPSQSAAFEAPATAHWREARSPEADNIDAGPVTEADLYDNLFRPLDAPF